MTLFAQMSSSVLSIDHPFMGDELMWSQDAMRPANSSITEGTSLRWHAAAQLHLIRIAQRTGVPAATRASAMVWLGYLPDWVVEPSVGAGDDGTISIEWDRGQKHLHVMFDHDGAEAYYVDGAGDEWESDLSSAADKLASALLAVSS